jgi:hypothetical protein
MPSREATGRLSRWGRSLVLSIVAVLWPAVHATAQMLPFVPDPVTTPELAKYAGMLGLSEGQYLAALDVHDAYRAEFRDLEDDEVRTFVEDLTGTARVFSQEGFRIPPRSQLEGLVEQLDGIILKAVAIDRRLFDRLAPILTEEQLANLPSVRTEREMDVYGHLMDMPRGMNPAAPIVLSSMVRDLDLSDEEITRAEEPLRQYERNAIRRIRKVYQLMKDAVELALDTLDRTGLRDMTPMEMMQLGEDEAFEADMKATFDEGSKPLQAELFDASQQNLRFLSQVSPMLTPAHVETLRNRFYTRGYGRAYKGRAAWRDAYERALALETLDSERRVEVETQRDQHRRQEDQLDDRIVLRLEAWREYRTIEHLDESAGELQPQIESYRDERTRLGETALATLAAILTPEEYASVAPPDEDDEQQGLGMMTIRSSAGGGAGVETEVIVEADGTFVFGSRLGMPPAMKAERRDQLARLARLDEGQQALLESLFADYRDEYGASLEAMKAEDAARDAEDGKEEENEKQKAERRATRMATLAALDEALFESMELTLDGDPAQRAIALGRDLRARERTTSAARRLTFIFGQEESYVDFVGVVLAMDQSVEVVAASQTLLDRHGETTTPLVDERLTAAEDAQHARRMARRMAEHGLAGKTMANRYESKAEESRKRAHTMDARIRDENRRVLDEMEGALGSDLRWTIRVAYQRTAFPEVYEDELGLDDAVADVRTLDDLTPPQREQVERIVEDYRARFSELSERMVHLRRERAVSFTPMQMPSQEVIQGEIELERLRFDRREAGSRAILRMRLVLNDAQIGRSGLRELPAGGRRAFDND